MYKLTGHTYCMTWVVREQITSDSSVWCSSNTVVNQCQVASIHVQYTLNCPVDCVVYIFIHIHTHTYIDKHKYIHILNIIYIYMYLHIPIYAYKYAYMCIYIYVQCIYTWSMYVYMYVYTYIYLVSSVLCTSLSNSLSHWRISWLSTCLLHIY